MALRPVLETESHEYTENSKTTNESPQQNASQVLTKMVEELNETKLSKEDYIKLIRLAYVGVDLHYKTTENATTENATTNADVDK